MWVLPHKLTTLYFTTLQEHFIEIFTKEALKAHQEANSSSRELQYKDLCKLVLFYARFTFTIK